MRAIIIALVLGIPGCLPAGTFTSVSAANYDSVVAPGSIASGFGQNLAARSEGASGATLPTSLADTTVQITDSSGAAHMAPLFFVSAGQINYLVPVAAATGAASVLVTNAQTGTSTGTLQIEAVAPGLFSADDSGSGVAAAIAVHVSAAGFATRQPVFQCSGAGACSPVPITPPSTGEQVYLELFGTGLRGAPGNAVTAQVGSQPATVLYAGAQNQFEGLDQINLQLPANLPANQLLNVQVTVAGKASNSVTLLSGPATGGGTGPVTVRFDPSLPETGPFPTDYLTTSDAQQKTGQRINLPLPDCTTELSTCRERSLLNELDGFHIRPRIRVRFSGPVDTATLRSGISVTWLQQPSAGQPPSPYPAGHQTPVNRLIYDPTTQTAYAEPDEILDQDRQYLLVVTDAVRDPAGNPVQADPAFQACIQKPATPYCAGLTQAVSSAGAPSSGRIVAASLFTTMSATAWLEKARQTVEKTAPGFARTGTTSVFSAAGILAFAWRQQVGTNPPQYNDVSFPLPATLAPGVDRIAFGSFQSPYFLNGQQIIPAGPTGVAIEPPGSTQQIQFHAYLPGSPMPPAGYPVVIFGHGYSDSSFASPTLVAGTFARNGFATVALNAVGHGFGPQSQVVITQAAGRTELPAGGRGMDTNGDGRIDDEEGCLASDPPVGLRDCIRQTAVDLAQLAHAIRSGIDLDGDGKTDLDPSRIYFAGISLGSIYGSVFSAIEPSVRAAAFNVGGATVVDIARLGQSFHSEAVQFLASRTPPLLNAAGGFEENYAFRDQPVKVNDVPGAIEIQNFFSRLEWLQASGDPLSYAPHLKTEPLAGVPPKPVLFQFAKGDRTVPNPANSNLIRAANAQAASVMYLNDVARSIAFYLPENPHTFLVNVTPPGGLAIAAAAQDQLTGFLKSDGMTIPDANTTAIHLLFLNKDLFVTAPALPEELNY